MCSFLSLDTFLGFYIILYAGLIKQSQKWCLFLPCRKEIVDSWYLFFFFPEIIGGIYQFCCVKVVVVVLNQQFNFLTDTVLICLCCSRHWSIASKPSDVLPLVLIRHSCYPSER
jgi:hypothetical protein